MQFTKTASALAGSALCGSLLLGAVGPVAAATGSGTEDSNAATSLVHRDLETLNATAKRYASAQRGGTATRAELCKALANTTRHASALGNDDPLVQAEAKVKSAVEALVAAKSRGDINATKDALSKLGKASSGLLDASVKSATDAAKKQFEEAARPPQTVVDMPMEPPPPPTPKPKPETPKPPPASENPSKQIHAALSDAMSALAAEKKATAEAEAAAKAGDKAAEEAAAMKKAEAVKAKEAALKVLNKYGKAGQNANGIWFMPDPPPPPSPSK
ncbi:hypothetical protein [Streptomyces fractus]|uniref:hypothetical protein n=1 Tax=Streptomyces fractus TaxID=641806 RepID=UPI003CF387D3